MTIDEYAQQIAEELKEIGKEEEDDDSGNCFNGSVNRYRGKYIIYGFDSFLLQWKCARQAFNGCAFNMFNSFRMGVLGFLHDGKRYNFRVKKKEEKTGGIRCLTDG